MFSFRSIIGFAAAMFCCRDRIAGRGSFSDDNAVA
jgi:hypothetical protein